MVMDGRINYSSARPLASQFYYIAFGEDMIAEINKISLRALKLRLAVINTKSLYQLDLFFFRNYLHYYKDNPTLLEQYLREQDSDGYNSI